MPFSRAAIGYIEPGSRWQNHYIEIGSGIRNELLSQEFAEIRCSSGLARRLQHQPPALGAWDDGSRALRRQPAAARMIEAEPRSAGSRATW